MQLMSISIIAQTTTLTLDLIVLVILDPMIDVTIVPPNNIRKVVLFFLYDVMHLVFEIGNS